MHRDFSRLLAIEHAGWQTSAPVHGCMSVDVPKELFTAALGALRIRKGSHAHESVYRDCKKPRPALSGRKKGLEAVTAPSTDEAGPEDNVIYSRR
jgi:hypothetical protein